MQGHQIYALLLGGVLMCTFMYISSGLLGGHLDAGPMGETEYGILLRPQVERLGGIDTYYCL